MVYNKFSQKLADKIYESVKTDLENIGIPTYSTLTLIIKDTFLRIADRKYYPYKDHYIENVRDKIIEFFDNID